MLLLPFSRGNGNGKTDSTTRAFTGMFRRMWERIQRILDRAESRLALYFTLGGSSVVGVITGWISTYSEWVSQFGAVGWVFSGLIAAVITSLVVLMAVIIRVQWIKGRAINKWFEEVDDFNPMDEQFHKKRISIRHLEDPAAAKIDGKTFVNCDLIGPANIVFLEGSNLSHTGFYNCDIVPVKEDVPIQNAIGFSNVTITRSRIIRATILVPPPMMHHFISMGVKPVGFMKDEVTALQSPQGTEEKKQQ